jgi:hypothetical protein
LVQLQFASETEILGGSSGEQPPRLELAEPVLLPLPEVVNIGLPMTSVGDGLIAGTNASSAAPDVLEIGQLDSVESELLETIYTGPAGSALVSMTSSEETIMAVVSRNVTSEAPQVLLSFDDGKTWSVADLPSPSGAQGNDNYAVDGAIGAETFVVAGGGGIWTSNDGANWIYSPLATWPDHINKIAWDGSRFILAGATNDPEHRGARDSDLTFWESADGVTWSEPEVLTVDPHIRTADGATSLVASADIVLSVTPTQQWVGGSIDDVARGTVVAVSERGRAYKTRALDEWLFSDAISTEQGFITSATHVDRPNEPRFLVSSDGANWHDVGPAPGVLASGTPWLDGVAFNGPVVESGRPNRSWYVPFLSESRRGTTATSAVEPSRTSLEPEDQTTIGTP